jgi:hypothetical protein
MSACCKNIRGAKVREVFAWGVPGAVLVLMPKCPMCVAAYVMLGTGVGLSVSAAAHLRWGILLASAAALIFLGVRFWRNRRQLIVRPSP